MTRINWLLYAPQYHFAMAVVAVSCLVLLVLIYRNTRPQPRDERGRFKKRT